MLSTDGDAQMTTPVLEGLIGAAPDKGAKFAALQQSAAFSRLRSRSRRYLASVTALFLGAFTVTVALAGWAPGLFAIDVLGHLNLGMLMAIGLILLPIPVTAVHLLYAGRVLDPLAEQIREERRRGRQ
ncbi:hypothetical protein GCM10022419_112530 [Nonomuraea rosea]|uniref:DUF485 domain-containing protein n=1 Tax=Nonomuraea rosea TaxID=638574 RepID=A0ABP6ZIZ7_9ACTN